MFRVTIRGIEPNEDDQLPVAFSLGIPTECLVVSDSHPRNHRLVAAQGWAKAIGLARRDFLANQLGASQVIIDACTTAGGIIDTQELTPAPSFLCLFASDETTHWVLDNLVEAWLISVTHIPTHVSSR